MEPLTDEHIWPKWLSRKLGQDPDGANRHHHVMIDMHRIAPRAVAIQPSIPEFTGPQRSRALKIACAACNGRWMSQIEDRAKAVIEPLLDGKSFLTANESKDFARWAVLKSMVYEFTSKENMRSTAASDRLHLRGDGINPADPANHWRVWVGRYGGTAYHALATSHFGAKLALATDSQQSIRCNVHATTMICGSIVFHAMSITDPRFTFFLDQNFEYLTNAWPPSALDQTTLPLVSDEAVSKLRNRISELGFLKSI